jgi:methylene-tetrahydromethanopterin dehydrogenase
VGIGALTVGNVKYQTQHLLLKRMYASDEPQFLDFNQAFEVARSHVS